MENAPAIGTTVRFREDFGVVGAERIEFTVDEQPWWSNPVNGPRRLVVTIRYVKRERGCSETRLAYVDDLIPA